MSLDIFLDEYLIKDLYNNKILVFNNDLFLENFIINTFPLPITDIVVISKNIDNSTFDFIDSKKRFQGYTKLFNNMIFNQGYCILLDDINISINNLVNINNSLGNDTFINSYHNYSIGDYFDIRILEDPIEYNLIIICNTLQCESIYHKYIYASLNEYSYFLYLLHEILNQGFFLIFNTISNTFGIIKKFTLNYIT